MKKISLHPILISLLPILSLYEGNVDQLTFHEVWKTLLVAFILSLILWGLMRLVVKDTVVSALMATTFWILFFGFRPMFISWAVLGRLLGWIDESGHWIYVTRADWVVLIVSVILFFCLSILLLKTKRDLALVNQYLNWVVIVILGWNIFSLGKANLETRRYGVVEVDNERYPFVEQLIERQQEKIKATVIQNPSDYPDIYLIILDGYGRADTLQEFYNYDNSAFLDALVARGFYIAKESSSNYSRTIHSLASSLNMMYLDPLSEQYRDTTSLHPLTDMVQHNTVFWFLEQHDYLTTTFASGFTPTEFQDADDYLSPKVFTSSFQSLVINSTPLSMLLGGVPYDAHRSRILFALEEIPRVHQDERPVLVFAHIINPHPPFVFDSEGNPIKSDRDFMLFDGNGFMEYGTLDEYTDGYKKQVTFISRKTLQMVDAILENAKRPSIIIIQGDHGPGSKLVVDDSEKTALSERIPILNAYYFPDSDYDNLYENITPINSFRVIFNQYLGTNLELLEDRNYFAEQATPYRPIDVTDLVR